MKLFVLNKKACPALKCTVLKTLLWKMFKLGLFKMTMFTICVLTAIIFTLIVYAFCSLTNRLFALHESNVCDHLYTYCAERTHIYNCLHTVFKSQNSAWNQTELACGHLYRCLHTHISVYACVLCYYIVVGCVPMCACVE